ncbi:hypothetical protein ABKN59_002329 [Abortiporus biennis]
MTTILRNMNSKKLDAIRDKPHLVHVSVTSEFLQPSPIYLQAQDGLSSRNLETYINENLSPIRSYGVQPHSLLIRSLKTFNLASRHINVLQLKYEDSRLRNCIFHINNHSTFVTCMCSREKITAISPLPKG